MVTQYSRLWLCTNPLEGEHGMDVFLCADFGDTWKQAEELLGSTSFNAAVLFDGVSDKPVWCGVRVDQDAVAGEFCIGRSVADVCASLSAQLPGRPS